MLTALALIVVRRRLSTIVYPGAVEKRTAGTSMDDRIPELESK